MPSHFLAELCSLAGCGIIIWNIPEYIWKPLLGQSRICGIGAEHKKPIEMVNK